MSDDRKVIAAAKRIRGFDESIVLEQPYVWMYQFVEDAKTLSHRTLLDHAIARPDELERIAKALESIAELLRARVSPGPDVAMADDPAQFISWVESQAAQARWSKSYPPLRTVRQDEDDGA